MANNIAAGLNFVNATITGSISSFPFDESNTNVIYGDNDNGTSVSWKPGRTINSLSTLTVGKAYLVNSKIARDLNNYFGALNTLPFKLA